MLQTQERIEQDIIINALIDYAETERLYSINTMNRLDTGLDLRWHFYLHQNVREIYHEFAGNMPRLYLCISEDEYPDGCMGVEYIRKRIEILERMLK